MPSDPGPTRSLVTGSSIGLLEVVEAAGAVVMIRFDASTTGSPQHEHVGSPLLTEAHRQLAEYFAGRRRVFDLPLRPAGTDFQRRVWDVLATIPWGTTTTYGWIADRLGLPPGASRAVGAANGANPIPVVLPCHRVVGADGTLTGYAGGLERKAELLRLEGVATEADQGALF
ncbi:methylated-DNA--[protein]-cysteine S-methyltransferase [Oryzobacter sp. R7]|uniref:methylated-DNA--[protein]-cysteine S-methyltransferase n=1 Tax=Oryzobacter faecalis TaxID=3388656 RepID=UPI00398C8E2A